MDEKNKSLEESEYGKVGKNEEIKVVKYGVDMDEIAEKGKYANKIIGYNEARTLEFTGNVKIFPKEEKGFEQDNYQFELVYDYFNGEKMVFEASISSPVAKQIKERLDKGINVITIARFPGGKLGKGYFKVLTDTIDGIIWTGKAANIPRPEKTSEREPESLNQILNLITERLAKIPEDEYVGFRAINNQGLPGSVRHQLEYNLREKAIPGYVINVQEVKNVIYITKVKK